MVPSGLFVCMNYLLPYRGVHPTPNGAAGIVTPEVSSETSPQTAKSASAAWTTRLKQVPWLALSVAAVACLVYLASELYVFGGLVLPLDDGWIHLQFARQLAAGHGLAYNDPIPDLPGSGWISGSTAPLWTALLALTFLLPGGPLIWVKGLGIAFFLGSVHATDRLAAELGLGAGGRRLAAVLTAATPWLVWSALSGMEIMLFAYLSLWGIVLHLRERVAASGAGATRPLPASLAVLAASALARPEGTLLLVLAVADRLVRFAVSSPQDGTDETSLVVATGDRASWGTGLLAAVAILVPTWVFYLIAGGSILPTTFAVKAGPPPDLIPSGRYLAIVLDVFFRSQPVMLLVAGAGVLRLVARLGTRRDRGLLPALWPIAFALAYSFLASPAGPVAVGNFGRYYFPLLPVIVVLGVVGLEPAGRRLGRVMRGILIAAIVAPQLWGLMHGPPRYLQTLANVEDSDVAAARWLADRLPAEALLAVQDIGALKYHLPNRIVDLTGIVNPRILPYLHGSGPQDPTYWESRLLRYLAEEKPDYLVVFPRSYPMLTGAGEGFDQVKSFKVRDNVTMAGDELAIFSTPWTRFPLTKP